MGLVLTCIVVGYTSKKPGRGVTSNKAEEIWLFSQLPTVFEVQSPPKGGCFL